MPSLRYSRTSWPPPAGLSSDRPFQNQRAPEVYIRRSSAEQCAHTRIRPRRAWCLGPIQPQKPKVPMGDKSPKSVNKASKQKQAKAATANQSKQKAIADQKAQGKKK